jgi:stage IV sporulation protein FB
LGFLREPQSTRYDLRFRLLGVPVRVHPLFWIFSLILGAGYSNPLLVLFWVAAVFVSILLHELGHALMLRRFAQPARIVLHAGGGLTVPEPFWWGGRSIYTSLKPAQDVLISLAGPLTGFLFGGLICAAAAAAGASVQWGYGFLPIPEIFFPWSMLLSTLASILLSITIFWGVINLMPVYPLDGGNIVRRLLLRLDPADGANKSLWISVFAAGALALLGLIFLSSVLMLVFFGLLAVQSYLLVRGRSLDWF